MIDLINDWKLLSTLKKVKDDFDIVEREHNEDELSLKVMDNRYNMVA